MEDVKRVSSNRTNLMPYFCGEQTPFLFFINEEKLTSKKIISYDGHVLSIYLVFLSKINQINQSSTTLPPPFPLQRKKKLKNLLLSYFIRLQHVKLLKCFNFNVMFNPINNIYFPSTKSIIKIDYKC